MKRNFLKASWLCAFFMTSIPTSAQEANEPLPVEYVRVCDAYGLDFIYFPGREICVNIDTGETRVETEYGTVVGQTKLAERVKFLEEALKNLLLEK